MSLLLIAYGFDIVAPTLSDASWRSIKTTSLLGLAVLLAFVVYVFSLFVFGASVVPLMGVFLALAGIAFVIFFVLRFFQGVGATQDEIAATSNLIPGPRREAFRLRYRNFRVLSIVTIVAQALVLIGTVLAVSFDRDSEGVADVVGSIVSFIVLLGFSLVTSWQFRATPLESLKLYGAPRPHEMGGFDSMRQQDEELFA